VFFHERYNYGNKSLHFNLQEPQTFTSLRFISIAPYVLYLGTNNLDDVKTIRLQSGLLNFHQQKKNGPN
jgi:hypothetical protein